MLRINREDAPVGNELRGIGIEPTEQHMVRGCAKLASVLRADLHDHTLELGAPNFRATLLQVAKSRVFEHDRFDFRGIDTRDKQPALQQRP